MKRQHLIILFTLLFALLGAFGEAWAVNRTVKLRRSGSGTFRYRTITGGTYTDWSGYVTTKDLSVADGSTVQVQPNNDGTNFFVKYTFSNASDFNFNDDYYYYASYGVRQDYTITCNFTTSYKTIKAVSENTNYGSIKVSGPFAPVTMPADGIKVGVGALCILSGIPQSGYDIANWKLNNSSGEIQSYMADYRFTVSANKTFYADFTTAWTGELAAGTYTLTSPDPDNSHKFTITCSNTSSAYHNKTYSYAGSLSIAAGKSVTIVLDNDASIYMKRTITVGENATLTIKPKTKDRQMQRHWFNGTMFDATATGSKLVIGDGGSYYVNLFGGANFKNETNSSEWDARGWDLPTSNSLHYGKLVSEHKGVGLILRAACNLTMNKARLRGAYNDGSNPRLNGTTTSMGYKIGGAILANSPGDTKYTMSLTDVVIEGCSAPAGPALYLQNTDYHKATFTRVTIRGCYANGDKNSEGIDYGNGIIRTNGGVRTDLTLTNCTLTKNLSLNSSGCVTWNAAGQASTKLTISGGSITYNDGVNGGAVNTSGETVISNCNISYNNVRVSPITNNGGNGAAIYVPTYGGGGATGTDSDDHSGEPASITIQSGSKIHHNTATAYGGAIYYRINRSNAIGFNEAGTAIDVTFSVVIDGSELYNNTSNLGGAVCIVDDAARKHKNQRQNLNNGSANPAYGKWSGVYNRKFEMKNGAKIYNNYITNSSTSVRYGGAIYIQKGKNTAIESGEAGYNYANTNLGSPSAGTMTVTLSGSSSEIYGNTCDYGNGGGLAIQNYEYTGDALPTGYVSETNTTISDISIYNNSCKKSDLAAASSDNGHGGAIFINGGNLTINSGTIGKSGSPNKTTGGHGGGIYVRTGTITMKGGTVSYNQAKTGTYNSTNYGGSGGGFYITNGEVEVQGGTISNNTADLNGGGFYVNTSNATKITKINSSVATTTISSNNAVNGGGAYIQQGQLQIESSATTISSNQATTTSSTTASGGGVYVNGGTVSVTDAKIQTNTAKTDGGGIYSKSGTVTLTSATLSGNTATNGNGGGVYAASTVNVYSSSLTGNKAEATANGMGGGIYATGSSTQVNITAKSGTTTSSVLTGNKANLGGAVYAAAQKVTVGYGTIGNTGTGNANTASQDGGGIYAAGPVELNTGAIIQCNTATNDGGGVYVNNGTFTMNTGTIGGSSATYANKSTGGNGGGVYVKGTNAKVEVKGGTINFNTASSTATNKGNGGGIYVESTGSDGTSLSGAASITNNTAKQNGGGLYVVSGTISVGSTGGISGNKAETANGGGIYMGGGSCSVTAGNIGVSGKANQAVNGGGIFATGGTITINGGNVTYNTASASGGGIYSNSGTVTVSSGNVNNNLAATDGGGIYAKGIVNFSNGNIKNNAATAGDGGGVYIYSSGTLNVSGTAEMSANMVQNGFGGGVYQGGTMFADGSSFSVVNNTRNASKEASKNNVYLPNNHTVKVGPNISTNVNLGVYTQQIATLNNDIPVLTSDAANTNKLEAIYNAMLTGTSNIRDDRNLHQPVYPGEDNTGKTLYFGYINFDYGPWDEAYEGPITDIETLYQYMCWVNGVNGYGTPHPTATGEMAADVNADGLTLWIPIGEQNVIGETEPFKGTFNGNGHRIDGLDIDNLLYSNYGLFGTTQGATIDNVFVTGCNFAKNTTGTMGTVVGHMQGGTLSNCTGSGSLTTTAPDCIVGGLAGKVEMDGSTAATVHSSYAGATIEGYQMGGLIGDLASGCSLYNSFANPQFDYSGPSGSSANFIGGLVAVNSGTVQNCYVRFSRTNSGLANARFGQLAGSAGSNLVSLCYTPETFTTVPAAIMNTGTLTYNTYGTVVAPYLYNTDGDNLVTGTSSKLVNTLNTWVNSHSGYTPWRRTMAGGTAYTPTAGDINGDYPVHQYSGTKCVGSPDGIQLDYASSLDAMLLRYPTAGAINLYEDDEAEGSTGANVVVYIDEGVCLLQGDDSEIEAYTCQTLPGNPRGWHFLSSSLEDSHIGFNYGIGSQVPFNWDPNPCHVTIDGNDDYSLFPSDLPLAGGYADMTRLDLFTFYEPEYHWVNLKRNSNSHWHMDATTAPINYSNETELEPGRGYLVTFDKDQLLQNRGTLNNGEVTVGVTRTMAAAWAGFLGCNLIGNPYQSYLDFDRFATVNSGLWTGKSSAERTYAVYDPQEQAYVQYKEGTSRGAKAATGTLNMHQGFFVKVTSGAPTQAVFNNTMRTDTPAAGTHFRGPQHAYPLVNLTVRDDEGHGDVVVLELGRDSDEGANKIEVSDTKGRLALRLGEQDYGILFRSEIEDYQPLGFEAREAGTFTLSWETANAQFESLTLVDNITGATIDMLARDSYSFEATPDQYASRFKIVVGEYKGIEEEDGSSTGPVTFAYQTGDQLVVEGEGLLQVVDMLGRVVRTEQLTDVRSTVALPATAGVYVLRLVGSNGTRTQKMVIR